MNNRDYYKTPAHIKWRKAVFARDKGTCQHPGCGKRRGLQPHHIKRATNYPLLRTEISNGISLCREHHRQTFGREEEFEQLYTNIVKSKTTVNPSILRFKHTGKLLNE